MKKLSQSFIRAIAKSILVFLLGSLIMTWPCNSFSQTIKDVATDATDPNNLADTEPSIAVDPSNPQRIAIVSFSEPWGTQTGAPVWLSTDGGNTWTKVKQIPQPPTGFAGPGDQKLAFDSTGKLLVAELDFGLDDFVYRQTGPPGANLAAGASYGNDQPHLDVDKTGASPCFNRVYSPWLNTGVAPNRSNIEKSPDFGVTVADTPVGNPGFNNRTTRIAVAPNGKAYIIYKSREGAVGSDFENAHFRVMRSDDCGVTWNALGPVGVAVHSGTAVTWFTNNFGNPVKGKVARARSSDAWIAVDPGSGTVYAAFVNKDGSGFGQIFVARSTDQGATWSNTRVTDGTHNSAYPEIAVAANGAIGVLYIDYDDSGANTIFRHRLARSFDHNATWSSVILQSMDPGPITNASSGFLWGDYEGITAAGNNFYGVFTGQSIGRALLQLDPIFFKAPATPTQSVPVKWVASFHVGATFPHNNLSAFSSSISIGADLEYRFPSIFSLETYLGYDRFSSNVAGLPDFWFVNLSERLKATFGTGAVRPFVFAGAGPYFGQSGGTHAGINTGGGIQDWFAPKVAIEGSYTFHTVFTPVINTRYSTLLVGVRLAL